MNDLLAPGRVLGGRYRLVEEIARGGMARVWAAEDPVLRRRVAVKILDPTLADDEHVRQRFRHEAIAAAGLGHPGIVATYDTGEDDGVAYIVMELVGGTTLRRLLDERGRLDVDETADIGAQVADALAHAHSRGLIHRDVKPGNVLVEPDGRVKVTDFGIAKAAGTSELTRAGAVVGTARYLAPEQVEGGPVDARTDVYALGLVLYEMLSGQTPFDGDNEIANAVARLRATPVPVGIARPEVPRAVQEVVARCLARDPADRPASASEVRDVLGPFRRDGFLDLTTANVPAAGTRPAARQERPLTPPDPGTGPTGATVSPAAVAAPGPAVAPHIEHGAARRLARAIVLGLITVVLVVVVLVAFAGRGDQNGRSASGPPAPAATPNHVPLRIVAVKDYDPFGDQVEDSRDVTKIADGRRDTAWSTETYRTRDLGKRKPGVGVWFQLGTPAAVRTLTVHAEDSGWNAEVYLSDTQPAGSLPGQPVATVTNQPEEATIPIARPKQARYVLLWITYLPPSGKLHIAEVELAS
ncbi:MAG TPA: protein kinase [Acidimicrobiia bacterium]|jgi:serine/threonine-protein kinase